MIQPIRREELRAPARVIDIELGEEHESGGIDVDGYENVWCLSRRNGVPDRITFWDVADELHIASGAIADLLRADEKVDWPLNEDEPPDSNDVGLTVAICTHERPEDLRRVLRSLVLQSDPRFTTIVIDNAPKSTATARVVAESSLPNCDYLIEPEKGLSRARNTALAHIQSPYVAWIDDDEMADADWIRRIKQGFAHEGKPAAVCGVMLPAELESEAQVRFEQYGGFNKGRGLDPELLTLDSPSVVSPLYPLPAVGSGGNMSFKMDALLAVGGFDRNLGAGTKTHGGEETRVFCSLLQTGESILHWPKAITWHFHRRTMDELHRQFYGYSAGLSAFYASMIRTQPRTAWELVRLAPHGLRDLGLRDGGLKADQLPADFPQSLISAGRKGLLLGAFSYASETVRDRAGGWHV